MTAISLGACATSNGPAPVGLASSDAFRVTLPEAPKGVNACLRRAFPEIPDRDLTKTDIVRIVGEAKVQDRAKTACGLRALAWITAVRAQLAR